MSAGAHADHESYALLGVAFRLSVHRSDQPDHARNQQRQFETEYGRLQAERQTQAAPARVEKTARDKLRMVQATPAIMKQVTVTADAGRASSAVGPGLAASSRGQP